MEIQKKGILFLNTEEKNRTNIKINGIEIAQRVLVQVRQQLQNIQAKFDLSQAQRPLLQVINIGHDIGSTIYITKKIEKAQALGIQFFIHQFIIKKNKFQDSQNNVDQYQQVEAMLKKIPLNAFRKYEVSQNTPAQQFKEQVQKLIQSLNKDQKTTAIVLQLPLHQKIKDATQFLLNKVDLSKDVDCLTNKSRSAILDSSQIPQMLPCAVQGIIRIFEQYKFDLQGNNAVMIGYSNLVGKILAHLLIVKKATVTICHIYTKDVNYYTKNADLVVSATGVANLVNDVKEGCILIDVGYGKNKDGKLCGDISNEAKQKASYYTPVPGGIGPMTIAMLMQNISKLWRAKHQKRKIFSQ